jgi:uncharacterized cupin superfamily protein
MPIKSIADIPLLAGPSHPVAAVDRCKARRKQALGDAVGLDQFGVNRVELDPGIWSTVRHWHSHEDEFVMVLEGELTLVTDARTQTLRVNDCAGFKAGDTNAHRLENRSDKCAVYLEVGSRMPDCDEVTYPDDDLMIRFHTDGKRYYMNEDGKILAAAD